MSVKILNNVENIRRLILKKVSFLFLLIFLSVILTACSNEYISITEDESNAIAQYCSYLLLKYDKNHRDEIRLLDENTDFVNELAALPGVKIAVLVSYNGDYMG